MVIIVLGTYATQLILGGTMVTKRSRSADFPKRHSTPKDEIFSNTSVIAEVSKRTGFTKADIKLVILTFQYIICEEFAAGKRLFIFQPFYKLWSQTIKGRKGIKTYFGDGRVVDIPDRRRIKFQPFSEYNFAVDSPNYSDLRRVRQKKGRE